MSQLFRPEVHAAKSEKWLGSVRLTQPRSSFVLACAGLVVAVVIVGFVTLGTYTKTAKAVGLVAPIGGTLRLTAAEGGTVTEVMAKEGKVVAPGDILFVVSSERTSVLGQTRKLVAQELTRRSQIVERDATLSRLQVNERARGIAARTLAISSEIASFARDEALIRERERIALDTLERYERMSSTGFFSSTQVASKKEELLALQMQQQALFRSKAALEREKDSLATQSAEIRGQGLREVGDNQRNQALLAQEATENQARRSLMVVAPVHGTVTAINAHSGQSISAGAILATLIPNDSRGDPQAFEAQFFVTARQVGFVDKGQLVRIRYSAFPFQKFGMGEGEVREVSGSPYVLEELPPNVAASLQGLVSRGEAVYKITVALKRQTVGANGIQRTLKSGMLAEADIVQDTRRLWEWILEPVFSVSGKFVASEQQP